jgi:integrase/recombinase XerD
MPRLIAGVKDTDENDLDDLTASWCRSMTAERKSADTIRSYLAGVEAFARWAEAEGRPVLLHPDSIEDWTVAMLGLGRSPATVIARQRGVRRFSAWLYKKDIIAADLILHVKPPKLDDPVVPDLDDKQLRALLATTKPAGFHNVRDRAMIRLMFESGARASEVVAMELEDVSLDAGVAIIRRGKGGAGRPVPFSPACGECIDDYLRARRKHRLAKAGSTRLWLGEAGRTFGYAGLYNSIARRGEAAGLGDKVHPHQLRHSAAVRWLSKGGSTTGLMSIAGWSSIDMLRRYIKAADSRLAADEARRLCLGEL